MRRILLTLLLISSFLTMPQQVGNVYSQDTGVASVSDRCRGVDGGNAGLRRAAGVPPAPDK